MDETVVPTVPTKFQHRVQVIHIIQLIATTIFQNLVNIIKHVKQPVLMKSKPMICFRPFIYSWGDDEQHNMIVDISRDMCDSEKHTQKEVCHYTNIYYGFKMIATDFFPIKSELIELFRVP